MVPGLGPKRYNTLLEHFEKPEDIFAADPQHLATLDGFGDVIAQAVSAFDRWDEVDEILENTRRVGAKLVTRGDSRLYHLMGEVYDPPLVLWVYGNPELLARPGIAVVGTRRPTEYGIACAETFSRELVKRGLSVVSGLAYGIDAAAHRAALEAGGATLAVLGSGVDVIYPRRNIGLAREIIESGGAVISEYSPGTRPKPEHFPMRNRIVSGLTLGTLVIESAQNGGSMITAKSALRQNREVFAIPHSIENRAGAGNNELLREGATMAVRVEDILNEFPPGRLPKPPEEQPVPSGNRWKKRDLDELSRKICRLLNRSPRHIDELSLSLEIPPHRLSSRLLDLEMQKCIRQKAGKIFEISP